MSASAEAAPAAAKPALDLGSDVEIARRVALELGETFGEVPFCEGQFWRYDRTQWEPIPPAELRRTVHAYDGARAGRSRVRLTEGRINSILHELGAMLSEPAFFADARQGINCKSGFIVFGDGGETSQLAHDPVHRQRHTLPGRWKPGAKGDPPPGSLLARLMGGCFDGDPDAAEKVALLAEIAGAAALGHATRLIAPKAVVLLGRTAENGKSQILELLRGLLPPGAVSSVPPSKFSDERHVVKLAGRLLNASDELGSPRAIGSDAFKSIVTGEPLTARDLYQSVMEFRPGAQHVFACNALPPFGGGMDRGVLRRLLLIPFNRTIPKTERVLHIGRRIVTEESDLLLAWAVAGAERLSRRRDYPEHAFSDAALAEWSQSSDAVLGWIEERVAVGMAVVGERPPRVTSAEMYADFKAYAASEGLERLERLPAMNIFVQRVTAALADRGAVYKRSGNFRGFEGLRLKPGGRLTYDEMTRQPMSAI